MINRPRWGSFEAPLRSPLQDPHRRPAPPYSPPSPRFLSGFWEEHGSKPSVDTTFGGSGCFKPPDHFTMLG